MATAMSKAGSIRLIRETEKAHGVHESITEEKRLVLCTVKSVRQTEYYTARNTGYTPEIMFELTLPEDYHGESRLEYEDKPYDIIRAYEPDGGGLEIIAQRGDVNEPDQDGDGEPD
jgi:SPP1 family predicted phage head-tail adaptor